VVVLLASCAQRESDVGRNAITGLPTERFATDSLRATYSASWNPKFSNARGTILQVGNAHQLFAFSVLRFDFAGRLLDSVRADTMYRVDTVSVQLYKAGVWPEGDSTGLEVRVREIQEAWDENSLLQGTLTGREGYPIIDSLRVSTAPNDTFFVMQIPAMLWTRWIQQDSTTFGILIEPRESGKLVQFYSNQELVISYYPPTLHIAGVNRHADTAFVSDRTALDDGYLVMDSVAKTPDHLYISRGLPGRAALYFPLDSISREFRRSINRAELHIFADTLDPAVLRYTSFSTTPLYGYLLSSDWISTPDSLLSTSILGRELTGGTWDITTSEYTMDVTTAVASWVDNPRTNWGMQLLSVDELGILTREVFYSPSAADSTKRPKLYLWYTEPTP
jgi:hypothetical protein